METYCDEEDKKEQSLNLITHVEVEPSNNSDASALIPAIESTKAQDSKPKEILADSLYGSDDNCERAKEHNVELIAPTMGSVKKDKLSLADLYFLKKANLLNARRVIRQRKSKRKKGLALRLLYSIARTAPTYKNALSKKGKCTTIFVLQKKKCAS